jgi:hypothetical protein
MAEFETHPELSRVLLAANASLSASSKAQLQLVDAQYLEAQIPLQYMGRYKDSYHLVLQQRSRLEDELDAAHRTEMNAQHNVEKATQMAMMGPAAGPGGSNNSSSSRGTGFGGSSKAAVAPQQQHTTPVTPEGTPASPTTTAAAAGTGTGTSSEEEISPVLRALNAAKLQLAAAEDSFEQKRAAVKSMSASLREESVRLEAIEKAQLLVRVCLLYFYFFLYFCFVLWKCVVPPPAG